MVCFLSLPCGMSRLGGYDNLSYFEEYHMVSCLACFDLSILGVFIIVCYFSLNLPCMLYMGCLSWGLSNLKCYHMESCFRRFQVMFLEFALGATIW